MEPITLAGLTMNFGNAVLAGGTTTTLLTTNAVVGCINGKTYTLAAVSNIQPATTDLATGLAPKALQPGQACLFLVGFRKPASGVAGSTTLDYIQSEIVNIQPSASGVYVPGGFLDSPEFPGIPADFCPIGYITCKLASTSAAAYTMFTTGTTVTGAQNSNSTAFANLFTTINALPNRPVLT